MNAQQAYGCMAEFDSAERLLDAVAAARRLGYTRLEAYSPFAVEGLAEALGPMRDRVPLLTLLGGLIGGIGMLALEYYSAVIDYPIDVGGRPLASWPAFIPPALEMAVLCAALFGVIGMIAANGLPRLYHPLFNLDRFGAASRDGFFLVVRADDPRYDDARVGHDLAALAPLALDRVAP
jgi:hypothetical protein